MGRIRAAIRVFAALLILVAVSAPALAYSAAGDRLFPATLLLPQIAPGDEFYSTFSSLPIAGAPLGAQTHNNSLTMDYATTITDYLGTFIDQTSSSVGRQSTITSSAR